MSDSPPRTFGSDFKQFFLRGLVILLPTILTLWIVVKAYQFIDSAIAEPINRGVRTALINGTKVWDPLRNQFEPADALVEEQWLALPRSAQTDDAKSRVRAELRAKSVNDWWAERWYMDLIGLAVAIIVVYIAGRLLGGYFGRKAYRRIEQLIVSLPIFKQVYPSVKQVVDFLFAGERTVKFSRVVAVEYPRKGIWSVGFMTGASMKDIGKYAGDCVTVFIPSSPTPFTGYTITVKTEDLIDLPISVEEALRFVVSGGVLLPEHQLPPEEVEERKRLESAYKAVGITKARAVQTKTLTELEEGTFDSEDETPAESGRSDAKKKPR